MDTDTLSDAVDVVPEGAEIYLGGFGYNQPFAVAHELIRREVSDLRVIRASGDILLDQLVGAGLVEVTITSHCWNAIGPTPTHLFRRAVETGRPRRLEVEEIGLGDLLLRFFAGARRLPFVPAVPAPGTGQFERRGDAPAYTSVEFDGATHHVLRPLNPDFGFVHVHTADQHGNAQLRGPKAELKHAALACNHLVVTAEEIVPAGRLRETPEHTTIPGFHVDSVVEVPGGAHPSGVIDRYDRDVAYLQFYGDKTESRGGFEDYLDTWVHEVSDRSQYLDRLRANGFREVFA